MNKFTISKSIAHYNQFIIMAKLLAIDFISMQFPCDTNYFLSVMHKHLNYICSKNLKIAKKAATQIYPLKRFKQAKFKTLRTLTAYIKECA